MCVLCTCWWQIWCKLQPPITCTLTNLSKPTKLSTSKKTNTYQLKFNGFLALKMPFEMVPFWGSTLIFEGFPRVTCFHSPTPALKTPRSNASGNWPHSSCRVESPNPWKPGIFGESQQGIRKKKTGGRCYTPELLTWLAGKSPFFNRKFIYLHSYGGIFPASHVSFREGISGQIYKTSISPTSISLKEGDVSLP